MGKLFILLFVLLLAVSAVDPPQGAYIASSRVRQRRHITRYDLRAHKYYREDRQ